ncbi:MAG TPA: GH92 family glycosyl hydrolase, partial [Phnomibacter sp.]|nr:GH92 family glycosyl hydrolase [Phnomibacter sp.]
DLVNPLMGTQSTYALSTGNTYPSVSLPWGMNAWSAQTGKTGDGWMYSYNDQKIRGFKQTHQPSPWINDYGCYSLMPLSGRIRLEEESRSSFFSHKAEKAHPYSYSVYLADHHTDASFTPTERGAVFRFHYKGDDQAWVVLDAFPKGSYVKILPKEQKIIGYSTYNNGGVPDNFRNYFVLSFSKPFTVATVFRGRLMLADSLEITSEHSGAVVGFGAKAGGQVVEVKTASSFISFEQAELNLQREIGNSSFEDIRDKAKMIWDKELGRIKVEGEDTDAIRTFYSCLYRVLLFPRMFFEYDKKGNVVHYSPYNGQVLPGYMFTDNGFWDTFRAVFPFFNLMYPSLNAQIMEGLVNTYKESGWLPEWASPGHRDCMIGSNSASLIADAWLKGVRGYDIETLYAAMKKNADNEGPLGSVGRKGADWYNRLGYVPNDVGINESAARTLEYAYADYCLYQLAVALKKPAAEVERWKRQSQNYRNLFYKPNLLMAGRSQTGQFPINFNPFKWGGDFTEGNSWHYTWSVFHDIEGLKQLMGGDEMLVRMLDSVFRLPPVFDESYYGQVIHEIREMQIMNMGQYAHGNQPIQHMPYLYQYTQQPHKTAYWVREIMNRLYSATPDGYCGDEDNGQTSAWYVFSALGFYPVCPGSNEYVLGAPLFQKATITLENGKKMVIEAPGNSKQNRYVRSVKWNSTPVGRVLDHQELINGGSLLFEMTEKAGEPKDASRPTRFPFSFSSRIVP